MDFILLAIIDNNFGKVPAKYRLFDFGRRNEVVAIQLQLVDDMSVSEGDFINFIIHFDSHLSLEFFSL